MKIGHAISPLRDGRAPSPRFAWLASFAITIVVITALLLAKSAQAAIPLAPADTPVAPLAVASFAEEDEEGEEEEEEEAEDGDGEEEGDEGEESEGPEPPEECGLRTARAAVSADESQGRVQTRLSYTSFVPDRAEIEFRLDGPKGGVTIGRERRHLSYSGVLHGSEHLGRGPLKRVLAAREVTVTVRVLDAPGSCRRYFDRHLDARRAVGDRISWRQSDSVFGS